MRAFEEDHGIFSVVMCITDIVEDMVFSDFLAVNCTPTYIRYKRGDKIIIRQQGVFPSPEYLEETFERQVLLVSRALMIQASI